MHSPAAKPDPLLVVVDKEALEAGRDDRDGMPEDIYADFVKREKFIYYSLMFLNGSVLWAYYSCLSAQDFYTVQFANSGLDFSFLTTLCSTWPMVIGQTLQIFTGLDKTLGQRLRVHVGYACFMLFGILIMVFSAINFSDERTGGILVLFCISCIGFCNSLTESTYYAFAALFPHPKFTAAVQIGNGAAGILNVSVLTILRLAVGGVHETSSSTTLAFYLFFGFLCVVIVSAVLLYRYLLQLPSVKFLMDRNEQFAVDKNLNVVSPGKTLRNLLRIFKIIWVPAVAEVLVFFVSLSVFPGFGCAAARNLSPPYSDISHAVTSTWYCSPGIVGGYNYGDFFGRLLTTGIVYRVVSMEWALGFSVLRIAFIPLLLMGVAGTSLYSFGHGDMGAIAYNIVLNVVIGASNGLLSTVTIGKAPTVLKPEDRESGGALMVWCLFLGLALGSTFGFFVSEYDLLGL
jgi:equilibrative nucleoside transporter 1/2/3